MGEKGDGAKCWDADRGARTALLKELRAYWREVLFWMLLLPAIGALSSILLRRQIAGVIEACVFLLVAASSVGQLKSLGMDLVNWNGIRRKVVILSILAGLLAGALIVVVAQISQQPLGTESGWNKAVLAIALGPVLEEVIFRGYLLSAALLLARHLILSTSVSNISSIVATSVIFALAHLTMTGTTALQLCCIMITGCLYGYLRIRYRSTAAPVLAHAAYNLALYLSHWAGLAP